MWRAWCSSSSTTALYSEAEGRSTVTITLNHVRECSFTYFVPKTYIGIINQTSDVKGVRHIIIIFPSFIKLYLFTLRFVQISSSK